jgi:hypothetical protein
VSTLSEQARTNSALGGATLRGGGKRPGRGHRCEAVLRDPVPLCLRCRLSEELVESAVDTNPVGGVLSDRGVQQLESLRVP